jgi:predicted nuclease of predicted toxin-antitoxin system
MAYAADNDFVVITHDLDFSAILAATHGGKPSVVQLRSAAVSVETIGKRLIVALRLAEHELETGALVTIAPDRTRVRLLPLFS